MVVQLTFFLSIGSEDVLDHDEESKVNDDIDDGEDDNGDEGDDDDIGEMGVEGDEEDEDDVAPSLEDWFRNVQAPIDGVEKRHLVHIDLLRAEAGDLAPSSGRVISILEVFGGEDERREKHAPATLKGAHRRTILGLFHGEIDPGHSMLDADQIVQRDL
ncbi:MAG: hypothetical protein M1816_006505 [Peltula sp. TS41687]|nr:MAG: hypothetical protein M1816_006505 [Peltula sp. TS41687]